MFYSSRSNIYKLNNQLVNCQRYLTLIQTQQQNVNYLDEQFINVTQIN